MPPKTVAVEAAAQIKSNGKIQVLRIRNKTLTAKDAKDAKAIDDQSRFGCPLTTEAPSAPKFTETFSRWPLCLGGDRLLGLL